MLIRVAYGVEDFQISGAPNWEYEGYDVKAKVDSATANELQKLSEDQRNLQQQRMLQALLADRFKLALHREPKEVPVYALVIAGNGPKLQKSKPADDYANGVKGPDGVPFGPHFMKFGPCERTSQGSSMANVVRTLSQRIGRPVLDKTGLTGEYDFALRCSPDEFFTALQEQLGLKLESTKGPVEVLVIDHVERPSEN